jgi:hypothetical protein
MATASYESAWQLAVSLSREDQLRLIAALAALAEGKTLTEPQHSIMELQGLGKEIWEGIDAQEYVNEERASWNE